MNIFLSILYLLQFILQEQRLNPRNYFEQEINMENFIKAKEYGNNMYEKFQYLIMHGCL
jgi:hypothetical protein